MLEGGWWCIVIALIDADEAGQILNTEPNRTAVCKVIRDWNSGLTKKDAQLNCHCQSFVEAMCAAVGCTFPDAQLLAR